MAAKKRGSEQKARLTNDTFAPAVIPMDSMQCQKRKEGRKRNTSESSGRRTGEPTPFRGQTQIDSSITRMIALLSSSPKPAVSACSEAPGERPTTAVLSARSPLQNQPDIFDVLG